MLPFKNRLYSRYHFNKVKKSANSQRVRTNYFDLIYLNKIPDESTRFGIVVSKKVAKSAVVRNRVKRRFKEIVRGNLDLVNNGYWIVLYPKINSLECPYEELSSVFIKTLQSHNISR